MGVITVQCLSDLTEGLTVRLSRAEPALHSISISQLQPSMEIIQVTQYCTSNVHAIIILGSSIFVELRRLIDHQHSCRLIDYLTVIESNAAEKNCIKHFVASEGAAQSDKLRGHLSQLLVSV